MRPNLLLSAVLSAALFMFSCEGPEGPQGPAGTAGKDGVAGTKGDKGDKGEAGLNGKDASSSVNSTPWIKLDFKSEGATTIYTQNNTSFGAIYQTYVNLSLKDKSQPLLTKEIMEQGMYLVYIKYKVTMYDSGESSYYLEDRIIGGVGTGATSSFKIPGRETSKASDFANLVFGVVDLGEKTWSPYLYFNSPSQQVYENNQYVNKSTAPELLNKSNAFYRELLSANVPEVRLVTVKGALAGRLKNIDFSDYEAVKKAFDLED
ncbi:MAG: collagen-like protein [Leadbetterella sp.]|nr:collagen-like protein [Leadbetterella sp.]